MFKDKSICSNGRYKVITDSIFEELLQTYENSTDELKAFLREKVLIKASDEFLNQSNKEKLTLIKITRPNKPLVLYLESLDGYDGGDVISVPIYTVNFLKQFANKKNKSFILAYIKNIISIANDLNKVYHVKNYKDVDFKTLCNDFGYDTNWNLLK